MSRLFKLQFSETESMSGDFMSDLTVEDVAQLFWPNEELHQLRVNTAWLEGVLDDLEIGGWYGWKQTRVVIQKKGDNQFTRAKSRRLR